MCGHAVVVELVPSRPVYKPFEVITVHLTNSSLHQYEMLIKQTEWLRSMRIEFRQPTDKIGHVCWTQLDSNHDFDHHWIV